MSRWVVGWPSGLQEMRRHYGQGRRYYRSGCGDLRAEIADHRKIYAGLEQARVDGRWIDFLVDTGASLIALRESSAAKLGIHPSARDYSVKMQTANGVGKAARIQLNSVEVNGITVRDVEAFVIPDEQLSTNLLGMSFLSRVKFSHDRGRLVLEQ